MGSLLIVLFAMARKCGADSAMRVATAQSSGSERYNLCEGAIFVGDGASIFFTALSTP